MAEKREVMKKKSSGNQHNTLPPKRLQCSLCAYGSTLGRHDLQLHLDTHHRGWAENVIKKMDIHKTE
jgi:hypothetical protein